METPIHVTRNSYFHGIFYNKTSHLLIEKNTLSLLTDQFQLKVQLKLLLSLLIVGIPGQGEVIFQE